MLKITLLVIALALSASVVTATETPTPTETPLPTLTPTPDTTVWDVVTTPDEQEIDVAYRYVITAGDVMIAVIVLAVLVTQWAHFVYMVVAQNHD
jgi:hypothetical protein